MKEKMSGRGMPYFQNDHWQKNVEDVNLGGTKYNPSEMNQVGEYKEMVDKQSAYLKKHKAQH